MKPFKYLTFRNRRPKAPRVNCCVRPCRRSVRLDYIELEAREGDGWGRVISFNAPDLFICPIHRIGLEERGTIEEPTKRGSTTVVAELERVRKLAKKAFDLIDASKHPDMGEVYQELELTIFHMTKAPK